MTSWIRVDEQMPKDGQNVLACRIGKKRTFGPFFARRCGNPHRPWRYLDGDRCDVTPTHWMPIPELPND